MVLIHLILLVIWELLGLDALNFANEGKLVIAVERQAAGQVLAALHAHPLGRDAALIGEVVERKGVRYRAGRLR